MDMATLDVNSFRLFTIVAYFRQPKNLYVLYSSPSPSDSIETVGIVMKTFSASIGHG
jgi:hypothetical protein